MNINIETDNELLAKFLGYSRKVVKIQERNWNSSNEYYWNWTEGERWVNKHNDPIDDEYGELTFHCDWNHLMMVVDKIRSYPVILNMEENGSVSLDEFKIGMNSMLLKYSKRIDDKTVIGNSYRVLGEGDCESFIEVVFKSCVDFVKFIN